MAVTAIYVTPLLLTEIAVVKKGMKQNEAERLAKKADLLLTIFCSFSCCSKEICYYHWSCCLLNHCRKGVFDTEVSFVCILLHNYSLVQLTANPETIVNVIVILILI